MLGQARRTDGCCAARHVRRQQLAICYALQQGAEEGHQAASQGQQRCAAHAQQHLRQQGVPSAGPWCQHTWQKRHMRSQACFWTAHSCRAALRKAAAVQRNQSCALPNSRTLQCDAASMCRPRHAHLQQVHGGCLSAGKMLQQGGCRCHRQALQACAAPAGLSAARWHCSPQVTHATTGREAGQQLLLCAPHDMAWPTQSTAAGRHLRAVSGRQACCRRSPPEYGKAAILVASDTTACPGRGTAQGYGCSSRWRAQAIRRSSSSQEASGPAAWAAAVSRAVLGGLQQQTGPLHDRKVLHRSTAGCAGEHETQMQIWPPAQLSVAEPTACCFETGWRAPCSRLGAWGLCSWEKCVQQLVSGMHQGQRHA